jgi:hypothetical protein
MQRGAIVTVTQIATLEGGRVSPRQTQTEVVDVVNGEPKYTSFPVDLPGVFQVVVRHPSGSDTREITVTEPTRFAFVVQSRGNPIDILQTSDFSVGFPPIVFPGSTGTRPLSEPDLPSDGRNGGGFLSGRVFNALAGLYTSEMEAPTYASYSSTSLLKPNAVIGGLLATGSGTLPRRISRSTTLDAPSYGELDAVYWELRGRQSQHRPPARWAHCFGQGGRDLVSIPWLWFPAIEEPKRSVEIKLSQKRTELGSMTSLDLTDTKWGGLLDFVTRGRMDDAARVADSFMTDKDMARTGGLPEYALEGKLKEPLVAALGGIILVSNVTNRSRQKWDEWLENLAKWFPKMPDAAAILGYRSLQLGDLDNARAWLRRSVEEGMPFFSATFKLLMLGFSQLDDQDSLDLISSAAGAVDVSQPFTVIHIPWTATAHAPTTALELG